MKYKLADPISTAGFINFLSFMNLSDQYLTGEVYITWTTANISCQKCFQLLPPEEQYQGVSVTSHEYTLNDLHASEVVLLCY